MRVLGQLGQRDSIEGNSCFYWCEIVTSVPLLVPPWFPDLALSPIYPSSAFSVIFTRL